MFKDLFNKTVALAAHKSARFFLSFVCIIESIFFPIPPDVMIIPMTLAQKNRWLQIATIATVSSVVGGIIGYAIGYYFYKEVGVHIFEFYGFEGFWRAPAGAGGKNNDNQSKTSEKQRKTLKTKGQPKENQRKTKENLRYRGTLVSPSVFMSLCSDCKSL